MASIKKLKHSLPLKFRLRSKKPTSFCHFNNSEKRLSGGSRPRSIHSVESLNTANYIRRAARSRSLPSIIYPPRRKIIRKNKLTSDLGIDLQINKTPKSNTGQTVRIPNYSRQSKSNSHRNEFPPPVWTDPDSDVTDKLLYTPLLGGIPKQNRFENWIKMNRE